MRFTKPVYALPFLAVLTIVASARPAYAYLDPGTGSYILQIIVGVVLGAAIAVKTFWFRIKAALAGLFSKKPRSK